MLSSLSGKRRISREIWVGHQKIGGNGPIVVQGMTRTRTEDHKSTVAQIHRLEKSGCEIVRVACPTKEACEGLGEIKKRISIPLIADIHFNPQFALDAMLKGVDGIRINPGNIRRKEDIKRIVKEAKGRNIAIRIGINSGSLEKDILKRYGRPSPLAMAESAMRQIEIMNDLDFSNLKISVKSSDTLETVETYLLVAQKTDFPLHLGITEAGTLLKGAIKSSIGIGILLYQGIGDTIRVSLTADPVKEVMVAYEILKSLRLRQIGPDIISCPACGRCQHDLMSIALEVERGLKGVKKPLKIAVMGCEVNGPGEAKEADLGIAMGKMKGILFKKGKVLNVLARKDLVQKLIEEVNNF